MKERTNKELKKALLICKSLLIIAIITIAAVSFYANNIIIDSNKNIEDNKLQGENLTQCLESAIYMYELLGFIQAADLLDIEQANNFFIQYKQGTLNQN